jgi:FMN phosphatase YigB (HAD superfamily)
LSRDQLGYKGGFEDFRLLWCDHFTLEKPTAALLKKLTLSHKVYLLSNTNHMHYEFIRERFAFPHQVHGAVLSYRLGLRKPEPAMYLAALKRARVQAHQAVFIDDLAPNVEAARRLGIHALRYTGLDALRRDLAQLGLFSRAASQG